MNQKQTKKQNTKHWDQVIYELWSVQNPKEFYHKQCHTPGKDWLEANLLCVVWENLKFLWERVMGRIRSRTILVQRKGHTNQRPLSFECRSLIVEGYYIDAICSEGVNWNTVVTQKMQPWDSLTRLSQLCVSEKKQVGHDLIVVCRIHERRNCFRDTELVVELDMVTEVNLGINWKVTSYGGREKKWGLKVKKITDPCVYLIWLFYKEGSIFLILWRP